MEDVITLEALSNLRHTIGKGIMVCICDSKEPSKMNIIEKYEMQFFSDIKNVFSRSSRYKYEVFMVNTCNDKIAVYVTER